MTTVNANSPITASAEAHCADAAELRDAKEKKFLY